MKHYIRKTARLFSILGAILFNNPYLLSQTSPPRQGKVVYLFSQNQEHISYVCDADLIFDESSSVYTDGKNVRDTEDMQTQDENGNITIRKGRKGSSGSGTVFYSDFVNGKTMQGASFHGRSFIISDTLRTPEWKLLDETKEVEGMKCQKAKATVYGREYEVWFSADIHFPYGPWKLHGLPGLILEAHSTDGAIDFELKEIHLALDESREITAPSKGERIEGYANFFALQDKKTDEFIKATRTRIAELQQSGAIDSEASVKIGAKIRRIEKTPTF